MRRLPLSGYFSETATAQELAVFRIAVFGALMFTALGPQNDPRPYADLPAALIVHYPGSSAFFGLFPPDPSLASAARTGLLIASATALAGYFSRLSALMAALFALYALGLPHLCGKINLYHHLVWFALLAASSHCGDAWSLDRMLRGARPHAPCRAYALPIRFAWILMGIVYFFPGLWKMLSCGTAWFWSDNLCHFIHDNAHKHGRLPLLRLDRYPALCVLGGLLTVLFELSFLFLVVSRRFRPAAAVAGTAFHALAKATVHILFTPLLILYATFTGIGRRIAAGTDVPRRTGMALPVVGIVLIAANSVCGALKITSWPFAVYPTFDWMEDEYRTFLEFEDDRGPEPAAEMDRLMRSRYGVARWVWMTDRIAALPEGDERSSACRALLTLMKRADPEFGKAGRVRFWSVTSDTRPDRRGAPPARKQLIASV